MKRFFQLSVLALLIFTTNTAGQKFPFPEYPYTLINDYSKLLNINEFDALEIKLEALFEKDSIRIMVIIVDDLSGMDISDYAHGIADNWNVSLGTTPKLIMIMIKSKSARSKLEVFITAGNDMKEIIPDQIAGLIVENEIMPEFRKKNYYGGLFRTTDIIESLAKKELTWQSYEKDNSRLLSRTITEYALRVALVMIIIFLTGRALTKYRRKNGVRRPKS